MPRPPDRRLTGLPRRLPVRRAADQQPRPELPARGERFLHPGRTAVPALELLRPRRRGLPGHLRGDAAVLQLHGPVADEEVGHGPSRPRAVTSTLSVSHSKSILYGAFV